MTSDIILGNTLCGMGSEHVLVLHDWNGDHTNYDLLLDYLDRATFTYAFADLRGYGKSKHLVGEYTVQEISRDCLRLADTLGWQRRDQGFFRVGQLSLRLGQSPGQCRDGLARTRHRPSP